MIFFLANKLLKMLSKISQKKGYEFVASMSDEDAVRNVDYLAHSLRKTRARGAGITFFPIKLALTECRKVALYKERKGIELFAFEKWIKENFTLLMGVLSRIGREDFSKLPHTEGVPRIVILADFIVKYSAGKVTYDRIEKVLRAFQGVTPLSYREIEALFDAIAYRLLFELSVFAERSVHYFAEYRRAEKKKFDAKNQSDSYLSFYLSLHGRDAIPVGWERDPQAARLGFENLLAYNEFLTSCYIGSLRDLPKYADADHTALLSPTNELFVTEEEYRDMSALAKKDYLERCHELSVRFSVGEGAVAQAALLLGRRHGVHFGEILYYHPESLRRYLKGGRIEKLKDERTKVQGGYAAAVLILSLLIAAFPAYYLRNLWAYLSAPFLFVATLHPVEYLLKRFVGGRIKKKPIPQMDYAVLPERLRTLVVASRFIANEKDIDDALLQAETLAASEQDPAVGIVVLADFPSASEEWTEKDQSLLSAIRARTVSPRISILLRKRVERRGKWVARERKRGAILDLFAAVETGDFSAFHCVGEPPRGNYAILLDDDSELLPGTIRAAILAIAHPLNRDYDLMSFGGRINRFSISTHYGEKFLRSCGVDAYPYYSDFYADAFDCALYCGKAIVRISSYLKKLSDFFPDGRILSHDIIEGAVMRSTSIKRCVYEDAPTTFVGDALRTSRWQRGDVQLLPYAFCNRVKNREGVRIRNPIAPIYKLIIFINGMSVLRDFSTAIVALFGYFTGNYFLLFYALTCHLFVKTYALLASVRTFFSGVRASHAFRVIVYSLELLTEEFLLIAFRALSGLFLFAMTSLKMAMRSPSLLEWKPFRTTQGSGGIADGAKLLLPSVIALSALAIAAGNLWISLYAILCFLYDFYLLFAGRNLAKKSLDQSEKETLREYAGKIYRYFKEQSGEGLITDNLQLFPYEIRSKMTSPTNIGFAILSEVCAVKLELAEKNEAVAHIEKIIARVEGLEKWRGNLYNWYEIEGGRVMLPRVVSTVDSANFVACLIVAENFLAEEGESSLAARIRALVKETDFTALYSKEDKSLVIVRRTDDGRGEGRYDLLASEARLAYYFAIGQGVDPECYFSLGRDVSPIGGNTLLSWSGTAFEYMLPRIFLKAPVGSLIYEQERRSAAVQKRDISEGVFGRSECGYAEFDDATAYRYKAVGCLELAMSEEYADVIAPYASFLYLPVCPKACLSNLTALARKEMMGEYGFYEALDFEKGRRVISFMTHHQGMSLAAITNQLLSDELVRLFTASPEVRATRLLLCEDNIQIRPPRRYSVAEKTLPPRREKVCEAREIPEAIILRSGEYRAMYDALGRSYAAIGDIYLTKYRDYMPEKGGIFVEIKEKGKVFSPAYFPCGTAENYAVFSERGVRYVSPDAGVFMEISPLDGYDGELRTIEIVNDSDETKEYTLSFYADMMLNTKDAYDSHPAFSDMFLSAEYDEKIRTQYLTRKNAECEISFAAAFTVMGLFDLSVNCNSYNVIGRGGEVNGDHESGIKRSVAPTLGDTLYPCFSATGKLSLAPHHRGKVYLSLLGGKELLSVKERARKIELAHRSGAIELIGRRSAEEEKCDLSLLVGVCGELLFSQPSDKMLAVRYAERETLVKYGIGAERAILYLDLTQNKDEDLFQRAGTLSAYLKKTGISHVLVILTEDIRGTGMSAVESLERKAAGMGAEVLVIGKEESALFRSAAAIDLSMEFAEKKLPEREEYHLPSESPFREILYRTGEGGFGPEGYIVRPFGKETLLPYSNVIGCKKGGFVQTERGGGFTFGVNAREDKLTVWSGDALRDPLSEKLLLRMGEECYLLNGNHAEHRVGETIYSHVIHGVSVRVSVTPAASGSAKIYEVVFGGNPPEGSVLSLSLLPALGWRYSDRVFAQKEDGGYRLINSETGKSAEVYLIEGACRYSRGREKAKGITFSSDFPLLQGGYHFVLASTVGDRLTRESLVRSRAAALGEVSENRITVSTGKGALDLLYNKILPYQAMSARLNAKTGFYQCGGATGFRDQLQDALALLVSDPGRVRERLLDAAAHQYEEGDVQHWWHPPRIGVRTRISDDRLWLPYIAARYIEVTGDHTVLDEGIPFLSSPRLSAGEVSRYEIPQVGGMGSLREHLLRAIRISLAKGEHGLLKIGSGDWNDGLDRVGVKGRGESVWLTMFAYKVMADAIHFFDEGVRRELSSEMKALSAALQPLLQDGRYPLAFADDGVWLGCKETEKCRIALNPQTWAVLSGAVSPADAKRALETAEELVDRQAEIVRLSLPPFDKNSNYGYISAYPKGVRENGGQYTHAAVWYLKALLESGKKEEGYRELTLLNPLLRCEGEDAARRYMGEPYVLAGDIYGSDPYRGRAGWTWYTGSAAWLKYTLTEDFFGIRKRGDYLYIKPNFPSSFESVDAEIRLPDQRILIEYRRGDREVLSIEGRKVDFVDLREEGKEIKVLCLFR